MPFYEYLCTDCGKRFDERVSVDERNHVQECACGSPAIRQLTSDFSFRMNVGSILNSKSIYRKNEGIA